MSVTAVKLSGGTRNYAKVPSVKSSRKTEYDRMLASGEYDSKRSYFDKSGGFVLTHKGHNLPRGGDQEQHAAKVLASKGYKLYLSDERNTISGKKSADGKLYKSTIDIKTINSAGKYTIKSNMEKAARQGAKTAVLVQATDAMSREYIEKQIQLFRTTSPKKARDKLEYVIVITRVRDNRYPKKVESAA